MIKTVFFDVGHTLVNIYPADKKNLFQYFYEQIIGDRQNLNFRQAAIDSEIYYQRKCKYSFFNKEKFWMEYYLTGLQSIGLHINDAMPLAKQIYCESMNVKKQLTLIKGVNELLTELRDRGLNLGAISNWSKNLDDNLEELKIREYFNVVINSENAGTEKPDQRIFLKALKGYSPNETIMVGDLYYVDVLPALTLGMDAALYDSINCLQNEFPCKRITELEELLELLR